MGVRPANFSFTSAGMSVFRMSADTTSKLSKRAMVSSRIGSSVLSSSTETTLPARSQSSWLSAPMPGPISSTPFCSFARELSAIS